MVSNSLRKNKNKPIDLFSKNKSILIYAQGAFSLKAREKLPFRAKTADGILRYAQYQIKGVIDSECKKKWVDQIITIKKKIPIFKDISKALKETKTNTLIIGIAPEGGEMPKNFLKDLEYVLKKKIDIVNGMHTPVSSFPSLEKIIEKNKNKIWETRFPFENIPLASGKVYQEIKKPIVLTVGTDAAIGKLTTTYHLAQESKKNGYRPQIIPTGQTAIMIEGWGIAVDKCAGDFMAGAVEKMILEKEKESKPDIYFVEGQGSIFHPAYSTTSLALIHGSCPTHLILVHRPKRKRITGCQLLPVPKIEKAIKLYQEMVLPDFRKTKIVGIALNTAGLTDLEAKKAIKETKKQTSLPVADLIRWPEDWTSLFFK